MVDMSVAPVNDVLSFGFGVAPPWRDAYPLSKGVANRRIGDFSRNSANFRVAGVSMWSPGSSPWGPGSAASTPLRGVHYIITADGQDTVRVEDACAYGSQPPDW
jgi:hypothetical protein